MQLKFKHGMLVDSLDFPLLYVVHWCCTVSDGNNLYKITEMHNIMLPMIIVK